MHLMQRKFILLNSGSKRCGPPEPYDSVCFYVCMYVLESVFFYQAQRAEPVFFLYSGHWPWANIFLTLLNEREAGRATICLDCRWGKNIPGGFPVELFEFLH
jgi:hypothetical protein